MINYTNNGIEITDDHDPSKLPLILPTDTASNEVAAQHGAYQSLISPDPNWLGFVGFLFQHPPMAAAMAAARASSGAQGEPATTALPAALQEARNAQNYAPFATAWAQFIAAANPPAEDLQPILAQAASCNLPPEFMAALMP